MSYDLSKYLMIIHYSDVVIPFIDRTHRWSYYLTHSSSPPPASAVREKTEILYGTENVLSSLSEFLSKARRIDSCGDSKSPSVAIKVDMYRKLLVDIKNKGIKIRQVTEITKENIHYCKELLNFNYEIRHLDGIKANFSVSETEYLATAAALREAQPVPQIIYSNVKDIVEQQRYVFESFGIELYQLR